MARRGLGPGGIYAEPSRPIYWRTRTLELDGTVGFGDGLFTYFDECFGIFGVFRI